MIIVCLAKLVATASGDKLDTVAESDAATGVGCAMNVTDRVW